MTGIDQLNLSLSLVAYSLSIFIFLSGSPLQSLPSIVGKNIFHHIRVSTQPFGGSVQLRNFNG